MFGNQPRFCYHLPKQPHTGQSRFSNETVPFEIQPNGDFRVGFYVLVFSTEFQMEPLLLPYVISHDIRPDSYCMNNIV